MLQNLLVGVRQAARSLGREPGYVLAFVLTLGLGIGANTAIFSLVNGVLLRPLPYPGAERIVYLKHAAGLRGIDNINFSFTEIADYREQARSLEEVVEFGDWTFNVLDRGDPHRANGGLVTANFFDVLGMQALHGRLLRPEDLQDGAEPVAVLTHDYWMRVMGGDASVVEQPLNLTSKVATIVGVLRPGAHYATQRGQDFYVNYAANDHYVGASMQDDRSHRMTDVFGRVRPGVTVEQARAELEQIQARLQLEYPDDYPERWGISLAVVPWQEELTRQARPTLLILLGTAVLVLVIACANVANLSLTRLNRREHEFAIRAALGAGTARLRRLLLGESLLLALAGAALGVALAYGGLDLLVDYVSRFTTRTGEIGLDTQVLGLTLVAAAGAALALTLVPGLSMEGRMAAALTSGGGHATAGSRRRRMQRALVVGQVALAFMLLVGAGLLLRTLANLYAVDPGFDLENVLSMEAPKFTQITPEESRVFSSEVVDSVQAHPNVQQAAWTQRSPLGSAQAFSMLIRREGEEEAEASVPTQFEAISPGFFSTLGTPILRGRAFHEGDNSDAEPVVIVNGAFARHYFGDDNPIGRRVSYSFGGGYSPWLTIVGVAADTRATGLDAADVHGFFLPAGQSSGLSTLLVRTQGDLAVVTPHVVETLRNLDPERPIEHVQTLAELRSESIAPQRLNAVLFGAFAVLALVIASVGIAGVLAYSVSQRTREFGIRMALGAERTKVLRGVLGEGALLALLGLLLGTVGAVALSRTLQNLLFQVAPVDPLTFVGVGLLLVAVALLACLGPALRATRVDPMESLRSE